MNPFKEEIKGNLKIHLHSRQGMYNVDAIGKASITCSTKHYSFRVSHKDFKCFAGGNNDSSTEYEKELFRTAINPDKVRRDLIRLEATYREIKKAAETGVNDYYTNLEEKASENNLEDKIQDYKFNRAVEIYQHNIDLSNYENSKGTKFIIQQYDDFPFDHLEYRMFFDPFNFVVNFHSSLHQITEDIRDKTDSENWCTINGGHLKVIDDTVVLYGQSGDYGVYDDEIAVECARKLFPNKSIFSYARFSFRKEMLLGISIHEMIQDDLPF